MVDNDVPIVGMVHAISLPADNEEKMSEMKHSLRSAFPMQLDVFFRHI